jgi:hypothetical protein
MIAILTKLKQSGKDELSQLKRQAIEHMKKGNLDAYFKTLLELEQMEKRLYAFKMN